MQYLKVLHKFWNCATQLGPQYFLMLYIDIDTLTILQGFLINSQQLYGLMIEVDDGYFYYK